MRRRTYLAAVGTAALAGCSSNGDDGGDGGDGTDRTPLGAGYDYFREVAVDAVDQGDLASTPLTASVSVGTVQVDEDAPATVTVTLTNDGDEAVAVAVERCEPAGKRVGVRPDGEKQLLLMRAGEYDGDQSSVTSEQCWRPSYLDVRGGDCRRVRRRLAPGDAWERTYRVWDDPNNGSCLPPGPYGFEPAFALVEPRSETADDGTTTSAATTSVETTSAETTSAETTVDGEATGTRTTDGTTTPSGPPLEQSWSFTVGVYDPGVLTETPDGG